MQMDGETTKIKAWRRYASYGSLDEVRPATIPSGDPQFRDDAHLTIRSPDKRHPETQDGLIDGGVRPAPRLAVLGSQYIGRSELSVIDAEPAQIIDRCEKLGVVLLVRGDEYYVQHEQLLGRSVSGPVAEDAISTAEREKEELTSRVARRIRRELLHLFGVSIYGRDTLLMRRTPLLGEKRTYEPRSARTTGCSS